MTGKTIGHYEVLERLGAGGMGEVYKARDTHLDRFVAIKILRADRVADPERTRRFVQEAKSASALNHPNIVTIHDIARADGVDYIVMEFVAGRTLDRLIGRGGMKTGELLQYAVQAADALARAHAAGIVHRDLKPSNIMVTSDGRVKIVDFGLAKLAPVASAETDETTIQHDQAGTGEGWVVGTPAYMSPEQAEGKPVDARSDIFSFGAVLYEMATGTSAFRGESAASTLAAVLTASPNPPSQTAPHLPRELERVIVRSLRKEPSRRYQSMADLTLELEEIKTESLERIERAMTAPAARPRWPWVAVAAGLAVLIVAVAAWWRWSTATVAGPSAIVPLTTNRGVERMPSLSPDGTQVAFVGDGDRQDNNDIYFKPIDAVGTVRLTSDPLDDAWPAWSPSGRQIAFVRLGLVGGAVYVTPLVPGSEQKVADIRPTGGSLLGVAPSWTPDGNWLVVADLGPTDAENGVFLIPVESGGRRALLTAPTATARYATARVSPSGNHLAYLSCPRGARCDVWVQPLGANYTPDGPPRQLTAFRGNITGLSWMPDSRALVVGVATTQRALSYLWRVPMSGATPERLDWLGSSLFGPSVSGQLLAAERNVSTTDIWRFDLISSGPPSEHPVSSTLPDIDPEFSPDGTSIAFASVRSGQEQEIWVAGTDGSNARQLTRGTSGRNRSTEWSPGSPRWSHDGKRIVFDAPGEDGRRRAYVVDVTGGEPKLVSDAHATFPSWSPDNLWIYFGSIQSGRLEVWRAPVDGGPEPVRVTTEGGTAPRLSTDERTLYYRRGTSLFARPLAGGDERLVVEGTIGTPSSASAYLPFGNEVFYVVGPDPSRPTALELRATEVTTSRTRTISRFDANQVGGLTISPDGTTALLTVIKAGGDLVLVRNFR